jgi:AmmeMemoRadiSam system protein B
MRTSLALVVALLPTLVWAQAKHYAAGPRPTLEEVRKEMSIPSRGDVRGQVDTVGYASRPEQMARVWELSMLPPAPESFGARVAPGVAGVIAPHDDYVYAARVDRQVLPLVTARTVVLVGVFHGYRRFGARDKLVFDDYRAWRAPAGEIRVSPLRDELFALLPAGDAIKDAAAHDSEHSVEALVYWLAHRRPDVEILPVLVPAMTLARAGALAAHLGEALAATMKRRGLRLGRDVAVVLSADGTHYGADFQYTPFGEGGVDAFVRAVEQDRALVARTLSGPVSAEQARAFYASAGNPDQPEEYRSSWCGRFSVPFGLLFLGETARRLGVAPPIGVPVALGTSVGTPELAVRALGLGPTAPANLYHFVTHPAVAFVLR